jgi:hypothetical protein
MTVNVKKCEVVVFGKTPRTLSIKFNREIIPLRRSCKYLGVWLDGDLSGRALADAISHKFVTAVPVFFNLCRRLRLARLDLIFRLANALVFSLLYGCEFLRCTDVVSKCEDAWWKGVRSFYGLPNGVSSACLKLLFPRASVANRVLLAKFSLLFRGTAKLATLFPEAIVCDRGSLLAVHRQGFSRILFEWCQFFNVGAAFEATDVTVVRGVLADSLQAHVDSLWQQFSVMSSTAFAATVFLTPRGLYSSVLEASKFGILGVRAVVLAITGSLSVSYDRSRLCHCGEKFSFDHFLSCPLLGPDRSGSL